MPLRVLFLTPYYKPYLGGIERVIERLSAGMRARPDAEAVGVLTTHFAFPRKHLDGLPAIELIDGGVEVLRLPGRPHVAPPYFSVPLVWFPPGAIQAAIETLSAHGAALGRGRLVLGSLLQRPLRACRHGRDLFTVVPHPYPRQVLASAHQHCTLPPGGPRDRALDNRDRAGPRNLSRSAAQADLASLGGRYGR